MSIREVKPDLENEDAGPLPLDLEDLNRPKERWVEFRSGGFHVRYASPRERDKFRRMVISRGIAKATAEGGLQVNPGREEAYYTMLAEQYVIGWRNVVPEEYSPKAMGRALGSSGGLLQVILQAITEDEDFFAQGDSAQTSR